MQYIIIDLEWNQPLSYQSRVYREVGDRLIFEMIQIGAAKLDEQLHVVETLSIPIRPTKYIRIHPRIRRMTGLDEDVLADAPQFAEAMQQFEQWCGDDCVLLTWGIDDISVLQQNLDFFGYEAKLPKICDIQKLFSDIHQLKERAGLKPAMDLVHIEPEEDKPFHNAEYDSYYTALVFATCPDPTAVEKYVQQPKKLIRNVREKPKGMQYDTVAEALASEQATCPQCPVCHKKAVLDGTYVPQSADKYINLARCKTHGSLLVRARLRVTDENRKVLTVSLAKAYPSNCAYVRTKRLQVEQRDALYRAAHNGQGPDYDEALLNADRSSVPFEDGNE